MKKSTWGLALCVLLTAACTDKAELTAGSEALAERTQTSAVPVGFSSYMSRTTRAGEPGDVSTTALQTGALKDAGFGVFAYYHDNDVYRVNSLPDFMYNQQVAYKNATEGFQYEPLRYWPNEEGSAFGSSGTDRLSFFAYAPWVNVSETSGLPADGERETGIVAMNMNTTSGDPTVRYIVSTDPEKGVDLCWAEPKLNQKRSDDRSATGGRVLFQFHHATAKLNVTVDAQVDDLTATDDPAGGALTADGQTRIYVRSVTFTGFTTEAALNLNSSIYGDPSKARWQGTTEGSTLSKDAVTVYDGRADGQEGRTADLAEYPNGLNPDIIQHTTWGTTGEAPGVTRTARNLFAATAEPSGATDVEIANRLAAPVYVIPTGMEMKVTIVYDIETTDDLAGTVSDLQTSGISIENRITKTITTDGTTPLILKAGTAYTVNLHLGLNSVKFDALVSDWEDVDDLKLWTRDFSYNGTSGTDGSVQSWTVPETGRYMVEVWGGDGGTGNGRDAAYQANNPGGKGGYASAIVALTEGQTLYIAVGGKGTNGGMKTSKVNGKGGFNGGGNGGVGVATGTTYNYGSAGGGGGATHIALSDGLITSFTTDDDLLIVAGGGGGTGRTSGGAGGGNTGGISRYWYTKKNSSDIANPDPWYNDLDTAAGANRQGAAGVNGVSAGCCSEGTGGGGAGYRGGNSRRLTARRTTFKNSQWFWVCLGGCGGSSWAASTAAKFRTSTGSNTYGHGHAKISLLGSTTSLPEN